MSEGGRGQESGSTNATKAWPQRKPLVARTPTTSNLFLFSLTNIFITTISRLIHTKGTLLLYEDNEHA